MCYILALVQLLTEDDLHVPRPPPLCFSLLAFRTLADSTEAAGASGLVQSYGSSQLPGPHPEH